MFVVVGQVALKNHVLRGVQLPLREGAMMGDGHCNERKICDVDELPVWGGESQGTVY